MAKCVVANEAKIFVKAKNVCFVFENVLKFSEFSVRM